MTKEHVAHIPILLILQTIQGNPFTKINIAAFEQDCKQILGSNYTLGFRNNSVRTSIPLEKSPVAPRDAERPELLFVNILQQHHKVHANFYCFNFTDSDEAEEALQSGKIDMVLSNEPYAERIMTKHVMSMPMVTLNLNLFYSNSIIQKQAKTSYQLFNFDFLISAYKLDTWLSLGLGLLILLFVQRHLKSQIVTIAFVGIVMFYCANNMKAKLISSNRHLPWFRNVEQFSKGLKNREIELVAVSRERYKFLSHLVDLKDALKHNPVRIEGKSALMCRNLIEKDANGQLAATFETKSKSTD